ncbi:7665_t:CDS:2 [Dentiscutata heterogama]|uniref:7665_t:CDS:1 n=1 Tax=Dentiscutata heterogama TaxID=1316150 RepID=A0ACA9JV64_9GLOM|nr:7665_t:CDS:2 [Dentiscutata heterogama]
MSLALESHCNIDYECLDALIDVAENLQKEFSKSVRQKEIKNDLRKLTSELSIHSSYFRNFNYKIDKNLSTHKTTKKFRLSSDTLRRWLRQGKISAKTSPTGTRLYDISFYLLELITQNDTSTTSVTENKGFLYARASSKKEDLE